VYLETERLIELVVMARQGDADAVQTLYLDAYRSIYYLALRMVKNPEDAEDITQDVFITVQKKISELRVPAAFYKWVNQITVNKCNYLLRKYKGIAWLDDGDEILALVDDNPMNLPDKAIDDAATRQIILDVINTLPDGQRVCVMLYYYQQNTISQIADMLETNENTVKTRLSLARAKIRAALEEKEKKEGIKLYGIPLALTPILRQAAQAFVMPEGVAERMWENISNAKAGGTSSNGGPGADQPGVSGTSGHFLPKSGTSGETATKAAEIKGGSIGMKFTALPAGAKVGIIVAVLAVVIAAAGISVYLSQQDTPQEPPTSQVMDEQITESPAIIDETDSEAPSDDNIEIADNPSILIEPIEMDIEPWTEYTMDLDGDGINDTLILGMVSDANELELVISSSRFGAYTYRIAYDRDTAGSNGRIIFLDMGDDTYSLCFYMRTGGTGSGFHDGTILYGTIDGWESLYNVSELAFGFSKELREELGNFVEADGRVRSVTYAVNEETGEYEYVICQYLYADFMANGVGFGYTQLSFDANEKTFTPVKQWVEPK